MAVALRTRFERFRFVFKPVREQAAYQPGPVIYKVNPVAEIQARLTGGQARPLYTPSSFRALAKEAFSENAYGYRAVMQIAQSCAGIKWILYQNGRSRRSEVENHPLLDLWRRPNPQQGTSALMEALVAYWYITGNSYLTVGAPESGPNKGVPKQLWTLRPDKVQILPDPVNFIGGYIYTDYGARKTFDASAVMQLKFFNPDHDYYGLSPLASAGRMIDMMNAGAAWNFALLQNSAQPPGALVVKHGLEPKQRAKIEQLLREKYSGPANAGVPMVLEGDEMLWQSFGISPREVQWLEGTTAGVRAIGIAVGIPPEMLGDVQGKTYANYSEARASFTEETVLPRMDHIRDQLNGWLVPMFGDKLYLDYDRDDIEALAEDRDKVWMRASNGWKDGLLTKNEARLMIGYDSDPDGDYYILATNYAVASPDATPQLGPNGLPLLPSSTTVESDGSADLTGDDGSEEDGLPTDRGVDANSPDAKMLHLLKRWQRQGYAVRIAPVQQRKAVNLKTAEEKAAHWTKIEQSREQWYSEVASQVEKQFAAEGKALIKALSAGHTPDVGQTRALEAIAGFEQDWTQVLAAVYAAVGNAFGQDTYGALEPLMPQQSKAFPIDTWKKEVLAWLAKHAGLKIKHILATTRQQVQQELAAGVAKGESIPQLAKRLETIFTGVNARNRSKLVAHTEVISASNLGSQAAARATGLRLTKEWIATPDSHTRETHAEANGQTQPLDQPYTVGGYQLMFPGDGSSAPPEETVQCRCVEGYSTVDDGTGEGY